MQDIEHELDEAQRDDERRTQVMAIASRLQSMAADRVQKRGPLEKRWLDDLNQYNGEYGDELKNMPVGRSRAFVNLTRKKCNYLEARLGEMILPTDDRNYSMGPTPIPDVADIPKGDVELLMKIANDKALAMQREIDDQLSESGYNEVMRGVIHDAVVLGTGIVKSPTLVRSVKKRYTQEEIAGMKISKLEIKEELRPGLERVSPWHFFPDDSATKIDQAENVLQRYPMNRKELKNLCKIPGFDHDAIAEILSSNPDQTLSGYYDEARINPDETNSRAGGRYEVWEFQGCLSADDANILGIEMGVDEESGEQAYKREPRLIIWFCNEYVLKAVAYPYEDEELPYSVFCCEEDDYTVFGRGLPYQVRNSQRVVNSAWRLTIDNAAVAAIPPIIVDKKAIRPADGSYALTAGKVFEYVNVGTGAPDRPPVVPIDVPMRADLLGSIMDRAVQWLEMESGLPDIATQEGPSPEVGRSATGASLLFNSASAPLRRLVKQFDDRITNPVIERMYAWNMEFNPKSEIKGDFHVMALGSSTLMVREQQQQALMMMSQLFASNPKYAQNTDWTALQRQIVKGAQLNVEDIMMSEEEMAAQAQQQQQPSPEQMKAQYDMQKLQLEQQRMQIEAERAQAELQLKQVELELKQAELQLKQAEMVGDQQIESMRAEAEMTKAQAIAQDSQNDVQREVLRQQGEQAQRDHDRETQLIAISADQQQSINETRTELQLEAAKMDAEQQRFNAEMAVKVSQGSGI